VLNVDGINYTAAQLPQYFMWYSGTEHTYQFYGQLSVDNGKQYLWSSTTSLCSVQAETVTINGGGTITGNFVTQYYLTVNSNYAAATGSGWYTAGTTAYAVLDNGVVDGSTGTRYMFTAWHGDTSGENHTQSNAIIMDSAKTATAQWKTQYYLTVTSTRGSPTGEGWYDSGAIAYFGVTSPALGSEGTRYMFTSWTGTGSNSYSGSAASNNVNMTGPITETAQWQTQYYVLVYTNMTGAGTTNVPSSEGWLNAGVSSISAFPDTGYTFSLWTTTGAVTVTSATDASTTITVNGPGTLPANFEITEFKIDATAGANGVISPSGTLTVNYGSSQSFTITPDVGYQVADLQVDGVSVGAATSYAFSNIVNSHTIAATFAVNTYTVTVTSSHGSPTASGQVNYGGSFTAQVTSPEPIDDTHQWICTGYSLDSAAIVNATTCTLTGINADHEVVFNWQAVIIITPSITTEGSNGTEVTTGTPFTFETTGNITVTQISNPTMIIDTSTNTVTLSMDLTGPTGTSGFCNMTIPKSSLPSDIIPIPTVYIDGVLAESQGYCEDAVNFYVWYSTHFSDHTVDVTFPSESQQPTPTPSTSPSTSPTTSATASSTSSPSSSASSSLSPSASSSATSSDEPVQGSQFSTDLTLTIAAAVVIIAIVLAGLFLQRRKRNTAVTS
jgi:hypothetical protein